MHFCMVSKAASNSFNQRVLQGREAHLGGKYLSARWMVVVAGAILGWISLMPIAWI
ncbi:MAG: hypothetical protein JWR15_1769, partial [Prosthecobacter sp.]|nr:hypothetical protein [Prosthecobacter sp.]